MSFNKENIWIIGASNGIGAALAKELSSQGATLILSSRSEANLKKINLKLGDKHHVYPMDVANSESVKNTADSIVQDIGKIDRIIFMAAIYRPADIEQNEAYDYGGFESWESHSAYVDSF